MSLSHNLRIAIKLAQGFGNPVNSLIYMYFQY